MPANEGRGMRLFGDLSECLDVIARLEIDAEEALPNYELHWCRPNDTLRCLIRELEMRIADCERAHGVTAGKSYQAERLAELDWMLANSRYSIDISENIELLRSGLLTAYAIQCDLELDKVAKSIKSQQASRSLGGFIKAENQRSLLDGRNNQIRRDWDRWKSAGWSFSEFLERHARNRYKKKGGAFIKDSAIRNICQDLL